MKRLVIWQCPIDKWCAVNNAPQGTTIGMCLTSGRDKSCKCVISVEMQMLNFFRACVSDGFSLVADAAAIGLFFIQTFHTSSDPANITFFPKQLERVTIKVPTERAPVF